MAKKKRADAKRRARRIRFSKQTSFPFGGASAPSKANAKTPKGGSGGI